MPELVLNVHDLDEGGKSYDFPLGREWLDRALGGTDVTAEAEGRFELVARKQGADVVVHGHLVASLTTECSRCLEPAHIPVDAQVTSLLTARRPELRPEPDEGGPDARGSRPRVLHRRHHRARLRRSRAPASRGADPAPLLRRVHGGSRCRPTWPAPRICARRQGGSIRASPPLLKLVGKTPAEE
ncbi:MAG: hypothetical protein M5U28_12410 [Sandaracinaceae bacterium]|nr:hypothetical protein [Sandaracinaceae bacterium]